MPGGQKFRRRMAAAAVAMTAAVVASAAHAGAWVAAEGGCQVWNPNPQLDESATWSGACVNGRAEGSGTLKWVRGAAEFEADEGEWRAGRQSGNGVQTWPGGRYEGTLVDGEPNGRGVLTLQKLHYEGEFRDGKPNGIGSLTAGGETVTGTWKDGCLQGGRKASIGIPLSACR